MTVNGHVLSAVRFMTVTSMQLRIFFVRAFTNWQVGVRPLRHWPKGILRQRRVRNGQESHDFSRGSMSNEGDVEDLKNMEEFDAYFDNKGYEINESIIGIKVVGNIADNPDFKNT